MNSITNREMPKGKESHDEEENLVAPWKENFRPSSIHQVKFTLYRLKTRPWITSAVIKLNGNYRLILQDEPERILDQCDKMLLKGKRSLQIALSESPACMRRWRRSIRKSSRWPIKILRKQPANFKMFFVHPILPWRV
jgi:hypothetical protein